MILVIAAKDEYREISGNGRDLGLTSSLVFAIPLTFVLAAPAGVLVARVLKPFSKPMVG